MRFYPYSFGSERKEWNFVFLEGLRGGLLVHIHVASLQRGDREGGGGRGKGRECGIMARALLLRRGACAILTLAMGWIMDYIRLRKGGKRFVPSLPPPAISPLPCPMASLPLLPPLPPSMIPRTLCLIFKTWVPLLNLVLRVRSPASRIQICIYIFLGL